MKRRDTTGHGIAESYHQAWQLEPGPVQDALLASAAAAAHDALAAALHLAEKAAEAAERGQAWEAVGYIFDARRNAVEALDCAWPWKDAPSGPAARAGW